MSKIINIIILFTFCIESVGLKYVYANTIHTSKALRPPASDLHAEEMFTGDLISLDKTSDSETTARIGPEKLLGIVGRPKETAVIDMTYALASDGKKYISNRALKLFYPASGSDLSALIVAFLLIDKNAIDYAKLYLVDLNINADSIIEKVRGLRPFVDSLEIETEDGMPRISMQYKGRSISIRFYEGSDDEVIKQLPKDMNLLFYHAHGMGGFPPHVFRPIWESFIKHCEGPIVIFSHAFPEPLIELMADWKYRAYQQFDRWCTVMPMYSGGVAIGLDPPIDLELIKNAWSDFNIDIDDYMVNMRIPTDNIDRLLVQRSIKRLRDPVEGLYNDDRRYLIQFFERNEISYDEVQKVLARVFPVRDFFAFSHHLSGLHREIIIHGCAAGLRHYGIDISKPPKGRLEQIESKIKDKNLSVTERTDLLDMFLYVGGQTDPSSIADIYEEAGSPEERKQIDSAFWKSHKNVFKLHNKAFRELAHRVEQTQDYNKLKRYLAAFVDLNRADLESMLKKHPKARKRLFKTAVYFMCDHIKREGINTETYPAYKEVADWLIKLDLNRTLMFVNMYLRTAGLSASVGLEQALATHMPIIDAINEYISRGGNLTKRQKKMLNRAESKSWPMQLSPRRQRRHVWYYKNIELIGYLKTIFGYKLKANKVINAMARTPRHLFLPSFMKSWAYMDIALPTMNGQTISQPKTVTDMLSNLDLQEGDRVLEIGTGTGWNTAIMSRLVGRGGHIYSIEIDDELAQFALGNLSRLKIKNVTVYGGRDGSTGLPEKAPFDAIIFTCGVPLSPDKLMDFLKNIEDQLKVGGRIVLPITVEEGPGVLEFAQKTGEDSWETRPIGLVKFVPMQGKFGHTRTIKVDSVEVDRRPTASLPSEINTLIAIQSNA